MAKRDRRAEIMQSAEKLFTIRRFHEITLDDVARQARVGKGTIYRYFQNKDDLFFRTAMHGFDELCDLLERASPDSAPFAKHLLTACGKISEFFHKRRPLFRMMQSEEPRMRWRKGQLRNQWRTQRKRVASAVADILNRGIEAGAVRGDVPAEVLAGLLLGMLRAYARDVAGTPSKSDGVRIVVNLFLQGAGENTRRPGANRRSLTTTNANSGDQK